MVLITGFEAFAGGASNPSAEIALALNGRRLLGHELVGAVLPCVFGQDLKALRDLLRRHRPEVVICLGLAGGRSMLSLERVAINVVDARVPDNAGVAPVDIPVVPGGPVGYWSTLPIKAIYAAWRQAGLPGEVSQTAGTFVCNHLFYGLMRSLRGRSTRAGFIHVPYAEGQGQPALRLQAMVQAIELAVEVALSTEQDLHLSGGAVS
ncbi:pyroglutamyl-peptidase I [bacterium]|nr:pyroglutamyl-peptidase I [bacterium]